MLFLEGASYWSGVGAVGLTALAAVAGLIAWHFSSEYAKAKDKALQDFQEESKVAIASADARSKEASEKTAKAELQLEQVRKENLELQAKIAPRRLTGAQKETLRQFLSDDPGAVAIVSSIQDAESSDFADDLELALQAAHWQTVGSGSSN